MSTLAVPSNQNPVIPKGTQVILTKAISGYYFDKFGRKSKHVMAANSKVFILESIKRQPPTRASTGAPDPAANSGYEYTLQAELPEKQWEQFKGTDNVITHQRIPHKHLLQEDTTSPAKKIGEERRTGFWRQNEVACLRHSHEYKAGRLAPGTGVVTLNPGSHIVIKSGPRSMKMGTPISEEHVTDYNLSKAHYDFQPAYSIGMKIPTWTSEYYYDPGSFEVVTSST